MGEVARKCVEQKEVKERKSYRQLNRTFGVFYELSGILYLYKVF